MSTADLAAVRRVVALAEAECALAAAGRLDELDAVAAESREAIAALGGHAGTDPTARALLERAVAAQAQTAEILRGSAREVAAELGSLDGARAGVRAYQAAA